MAARGLLLAGAAAFIGIAGLLAMRKPSVPRTAPPGQAEGEILGAVLVPTTVLPASTAAVRVAWRANISPFWTYVITIFLTGNADGRLLAFSRADLPGVIPDTYGTELAVTIGISEFDQTLKLNVFLAKQGTTDGVTPDPSLPTPVLHTREFPDVGIVSLGAPIITP